jgi:ubiquitin carboxyl-terminal hydrolase 1
MNPRSEAYYAHTLNSFEHASSNQDDLSLLQAQNGQLLASLCAFILFLYYFLAYIEVLPFTVSRALWNLVVYLTPSRIVFALDKMPSAIGHIDSMSLSTFQAKSDAMRRIFGIKTSFFSFLPRARSLSGFGTALLGTREHTPPGLGNWDNSCYQNSIIQGLASLRSLETFLELNIQQLSDKVSLTAHCALKGIIERLNDPSSHGQKLWLPPELKSMSSWQQQDAQEYFSKIVDQIDREISRASRGWTRNLGLKVAGPQEHVMGITSLEDRDVLPKASGSRMSLRNPLEGLLAQRVGCMSCGWTEGLSLIPFNCLTVPLGKNWEYGVRDCLDEYMKLEPIEGVECAKCTLLGAKEQLHRLLSQITADNELISESDAPKLSNVLKNSVELRLQAVQEALDDEDFTEKTLSKKCHIPTRNRLSTTKSRQAVIARAPRSLVIHINRSLFDETTGVLKKNYANVRFPRLLELDEWSLGTKAVERKGEALEMWNTNPKESMLPRHGMGFGLLSRRYELRAVITHYGRHDNGHYICYRKYSVESFPADIPEAVLEIDGEKERPERWFRLSDDEVQMVSEQNVFSQGGVFMLFYERLEEQELNKETFSGGTMSSSATSELEDKGNTDVNDSVQINASGASLSLRESGGLTAAGSHCTDGPTAVDVVSSNDHSNSSSPSMSVISQTPSPSPLASPERMKSINAESHPALPILRTSALDSENTLETADTTMSRPVVTV